MNHLPIINKLQKFNVSLSYSLGHMSNTDCMLTHRNTAIFSSFTYRYFALVIITLTSSPGWAEKPEFISPLPSAVADKWPNLDLAGQTTLRRFGFHVYDSSLWIANKQNPIQQLNSSTCALSITYARKIRAEQLLSSTKKEWLRLGFADQYPIDAWLTMLAQIWPDVNKGDQLVLVSSADGKSSFYSKNQRLGTIEDADFGTAFLSIWLSENARFQKNRKELLGE